MYYANSISVLQQLLFSEPPSPNSEEQEKEGEGEGGGSNKKNTRCYVTKKSQNIIHMRNGHIDLYDVLRKPKVQTTIFKNAYRTLKLEYLEVSKSILGDRIIEAEGGKSSD